MRVFVSSPEAKESRAAELIDALLDAGVEVEHSPDSSGDPLVDSRWAGWYPRLALEAGKDSNCGLGRAFDGVDLCVIVVNWYWDSSTWMLIEANEAYVRLGSERLWFWDPDEERPGSPGVAFCLVNPLPTELSAAVRKIETIGLPTSELGAAYRGTIQEQS